MSASTPPRRSSSPFSASSQTHNMDLTPRSKVRAMLAAFDDDSDKENEPKSPSTRDGQRRVRPTVYGSGLQRTRDTTGNYTDRHSEVAHGARLRESREAAHLQMTDKASSEEERGSTFDDNAYERVKRHLIARGVAQGIEHGGMDATVLNDAAKLDNEFDDRTDKDSDVAPKKSHAFKSRSRMTKTVSGDVSPVTTTTPRRQISPGLFVSPEDPSNKGQLQARIADQDTSSDSDMPTAPTMSNRLKDLVARKRQERLAKEKAAGRSEDGETPSPRSIRPTQKVPRTTTIGEAEGDDDREAGRKLTQQARPTRKASKKALEDMHRETQRISRNMQLAHEAKTKIKFTKEAFLAKFNYRQSTPIDPTMQLDQYTSSSAAAASDAEHGPTKETPPSSPPTIGDGIGSESENRSIVQNASVITELPPIELSDDESLPDLSATLARLGQQARQSSPARDQKGGQPFSVRQFAKSKVHQRNVESDDDLEIVSATKTSRLPVLDRVPALKAKDSKPLHTLRALAHLHENDQPRSKARHSVSAIELRISLQRRAREQAQRERDEKIQRLKDKGIVVLSAEEKEKDQLQLENMLERARRDAAELAKREKEAAKKEGRESNPDGQLPDSDDEDEDWHGTEADGGVELSGSEDEEHELAATSSHLSEVENGDEDGDEGDEEPEDDEEELDPDLDEEQEGVSNSFVDNEASDDNDEIEESAANTDNEMEVHRVTSRQRLGRRKVVLSDDEDDIEGGGQPTSSYSNAQKLASEPSISDNFGFANAQSVIPSLSQVFGGTMADSASDAFGFRRDQPAVPGLSQIFAGTMADSQTKAQVSDDTIAIDSQQDSMDFLRAFPPPDLPDFGAQFSFDSQSQIVPDSQAYNSQEQGIGLVRFDTQTQLQYPETQESQMPNPTPDVGFQPLLSPSPLPPASFSTVDTVLLPQPEENVPVPLKRKGRLLRRNQMQSASSEVEDETFSNADAGEQLEVPETSRNAFDVMRGAASRPVVADSYDKKRSEAKGMVEEQAEESEDEYAGLGGASDDDSQGELDEETKNMIDDVTNEKVKEGGIAAFYADKERIADEKQVERIYRDIANGGLRRKRGADLDLFDSDDEDEAAARRRAAKQREFARMRKALLADEKLGKIAENPKQQAFLHAVEDREDEDELNILDQPAEAVSQITDSQSDDVVPEQSHQTLRPMTANVGKRRLSQLAKDGSAAPRAERLPPALRRTNISTRPTSIADIRNTLSEVLGEPDVIAETQPTSSPNHSADEQDDDEVEDLLEDPDTRMMMRQKTAPFISHHRRSMIDPTRAAVIDRMALKRTASSFNDAFHAPNDRLAFQAPAKASASAFRKPSLLRRATTAGSTTTTTSASSESFTERGGMGKESVKMGGTKKSSVNYYVREKERTARLEQVEKERIEGRERLGRMRRGGSGLGALVGGSFH